MKLSIRWHRTVMCSLSLSLSLIVPCLFQIQQPVILFAYSRLAVIDRLSLSVCFLTYLISSRAYPNGKLVSSVLNFCSYVVWWWAAEVTVLYYCCIFIGVSLNWLTISIRFILLQSRYTKRTSFHIYSVLTYSCKSEVVSLPLFFHW